jgi:predicted AAA+ superfamily ATPase
MGKIRVLSTKEFKMLDSLEPVPNADVVHKKLVAHIIDGYDDFWYRLKDEMREMLDFICFGASKKGFFYLDANRLTEQFNISVRTIQRHLSLLEDCGAIKRVWKAGRFHNGKSHPILLFKQHPYYSTIYAMLRLDEFESLKYNISNVVTENTKGNSGYNLIVNQ